MVFGTAQRKMQIEKSYCGDVHSAEKTKGKKKRNWTPTHKPNTEFNPHALGAWIGLSLYILVSDIGIISTSSVWFGVQCTWRTRNKWNWQCNVTRNRKGVFVFFIILNLFEALQITAGTSFISIFQMDHPKIFIHNQNALPSKLENTLEMTSLHSVVPFLEKQGKIGFSIVMNNVRDCSFDYLLYFEKETKKKTQDCRAMKLVILFNVTRNKIARV